MEDYLIYVSNRIIASCNAIEYPQLCSLIQQDQIRYMKKEIDEQTFKFHLNQALRCVELRVESIKLILDM